MDERPTKLRRPIRIVVAAMALVAYPLSYGPAIWLSTRITEFLRGDPASFNHTVLGVMYEVIEATYLPLVWVLQNAPAPVRATFRWYMAYWL